MVNYTCYVAIVCILMMSVTFGKKLKTSPHIVIILADDLGWNDVGVHGQNQFRTPNIDSLGLNGIILQRHYVSPMCTPSRAAFMTGRHAYHTGMFNWVIDSDEPWGMPLTEKTLPEVLQGAGYSTHLVGKWHIGFFKQEYSPVNRGFDTFNGYLGPYIDYWDHSLNMFNQDYARGYDMRKDFAVDPVGNGTYATDLFTTRAVELINQHDTSNPMFLLMSHLAPHTANVNAPLQAPQSEINKFNYILYEKRRKLAAMISRMDHSVGKVVTSLKKSKMLDNTVILFMADNGAPTTGLHSNVGSNHPLRGQKDSPWEGATRAVASIFSPLLQKRQRISNQYIHITDWFKTFAELAGVDTAKVKPNLDGYNVWDALSYDLPSPRQEIVQNIDSVFRYAAFINGRFKYIEGTRSNGMYDGWLGLLPFNKTIEQSNIDYADGIRNSDVGRALEKYTQMRPSNLYSHEKNGLSDATIYKLRQQATIRCFAPPLNHKYKCQPLVSPCLFDIIKDPCETTNLAAILPRKFKEMQARLAQLRTSAVPALNTVADPNCNPAFFNNIWTYWQDA